MRRYRRRATALWAAALCLVLVACGGGSKDSRSRQRAATAMRTLPAGYAAGGTVQVKLVVTPPAGTAVYIVEESIPAGWPLNSAAGGGAFDTINTKVKWVFMDGDARTLTYTLGVPASASGDKTFVGAYGVHGKTEPIGGDTVLKQGGGGHQCDTSGDQRITIDELTTYILGWKTGLYDSIDLVTNAIAIWKSGEVYHYDASANPPFVVGAGSSPGGGTVRVTIAPAEAVTAGARWTLDSDATLHAGGESVNASAGSHTVRYTSATGWTPPADQTVTVSAGQTTAATGTYTPQDVSGSTGQVRVTLEPSGAAAAGATWSLDSASRTYTSGETATYVTPGSHTVRFGSATGYTKPADQTVTVTAGQTATAMGTYTGSGSVSVTISPAAAVTAGAGWLLDSETTPRASGATVQGLTAGNHVVRFVTVTGWTSPADQTVTVTAGQTTAVTGTYTVYVPPDNGKGALRVDLSPADVLAAGARWLLDDDASPHASGETLINVTAGAHTVHFSAINGWTAPADQSVTVEADKITTVTGSYTSLGGSLKVDLSPAAAVAAGAKWTLDSDTTAHASGEKVAVAAGTHTIRFGSVSYFNTPSDQVVTVSAGQTVGVTGTYVAMPVVVTIDPSTWSMKVNETKQFGATVSGTATTGVVWSATGGSVVGGLYTAPASPGTYMVTATSEADPARSATATVTVVTDTASVSVAISRRGKR